MSSHNLVLRESLFKRSIDNQTAVNHYLALGHILEEAYLRLPYLTEFLQLPLFIGSVLHLFLNQAATYT